MVNKLISSLFNLSLFHSDKKEKEKLTEQLTAISLKLKDQQTRLEETIRRLKEKDKDLFSRVVRAQEEGEDARAKIYAQEIAEIRKFIKIIYTATLALEKVRIKLETVRELQGASIVLGPIVKILGDLKDQVKNVVPDVAMALDSIVANVNGIAIQTGSIDGTSIVPAMVDEQAQQILKEAQSTAEAKIKEILPDLPHPPVSQSVQIRRKVTVDDAINYIKSRGGFFDVQDFASMYGIGKEEVIELLKEMNSRGLISLEA
ncbi:cell division protein CdvB [Sulfuracidifex metallicus]|jgi:division protein CdvB (Snf7/Vps24/ESCRT-III family)|uniref:Cell division protein n=1 Tax=Sulfuracidifex metallicus DSM 6482 = JCM 9184 TaxID=523847 RepID=A0A6A9QIF3_SULME|nr:cell division protein CdvB [Sulfuracidifex metallicus]MCY0850910.1 cell division protein CdvB [Sulfuracidifex metallicus]MUN27929.1 cell division protein [Sulfuracidifex metallicus DSM 6482 = JCM 9184]WOE51517.1 cell division protein CdvB [Sulfuracidifex metallicus DSM 6482 = JCM 9184]